MRVTALNVHPVKSTAIRPLRTMTVTLAGPRADREWIVVDAEGKLVSARQLQALFSVRADTPDTDPTQTGALRLRAPGHPTLEVGHPTGDPEPVRLLRHDLSGVPAGEAADAWLRRVLGRDDLRLLWYDDPNRRRVSDDPDDPARARFPDAYPVTVATEASLTRLNEWVAEVAQEHGEERQTIPMQRFRPNIVLDGDEPFAEDRWTHLELGEVVLKVVKPVGRCVMTTVDPATLATGKEPLRTLARFRRPERQTLFCVHAAPVRGGVIGLGEEVLAVPARQPRQP